MLCLVVIGVDKSARTGGCAPSLKQEKSMKKIMFVIVTAFMSMVGLLAEPALTEKKAPTFDDAIEIIKKYEGMHRPKDWPFVGYGHKVLPTDRYKRGVQLTEAQAEKLLREDMRKLCAKYRSYGTDSLLLAALAYNIGTGKVGQSSIISRLDDGDRDIKGTYVAYCRYRGKVNSQIQRRRHEEFERLYVE